MDTIYLILIIFLTLLAVFDLVVGVSNDAVNFINSAVGSKAASVRTILIIAGLGVVVGASLSNGMMDVARHGVFQPANFVFADIMCIFIASMITDVFLIDFFNTLGLPTSTTVSFVFELLGATFAIAMLLILHDATGTLSFVNLINTEKALTIIMGIFLSVAIAFVFGVVIQFITRLLFTFNYKKNMKYFAAVFGGLAITSIVYFMLINGLKDSSFMTPELKATMHQNTPYILLGCFGFFTVVMEILYLCKVNILKIIVLLGTFALALAFAGNDLVNFIGRPIAAFEAYLDYRANGGGDIANTLKMDSLNEPSNTPVYFLLIAAVIMVITLFTSKKAHHVVKTELNLSRQNEEEEIFNSSSIGRNLVRGTRKLSVFFLTITPEPVRKWVDSRFNHSEIIMEDNANYDLLRASVNLIVAGMLIATGTSLKLPLSTTYVTFIVAMGSSLADRAWGRDSAVYRISGVLNVIGGWLITAVAAFMLAFVMALLIYYGRMVAIVILMGLVAYSLIHSQIKFRRKAKEEKSTETMTQLMTVTDTDEALALLQQNAREDIDLTLEFIKEKYMSTIDAFCKENLRTLRSLNTDIDGEKSRVKKMKRYGAMGIRKLSDSDASEKGLYYFQCIDFMSEIVYSLQRISLPCEDHIDNNFCPLSEEQKEEISTIAFSIDTFIDRCNRKIQENDYQRLKDVLLSSNELTTELNRIKRVQLKRLKQQGVSTKVSMIYLTIIQESQNIVLFASNLVKVSRRFQKSAEV
jgi:phosphate/sulfate permease